MMGIVAAPLSARDDIPWTVAMTEADFLAAMHGAMFGT